MWNWFKTFNLRVLFGQLFEEDRCLPVRWLYNLSAASATVFDDWTHSRFRPLVSVFFNPVLVVSENFLPISHFQKSYTWQFVLWEMVKIGIDIRYDVSFQNFKNIYIPINNILFPSQVPDSIKLNQPTLLLIVDKWKHHNFFFQHLFLLQYDQCGLFETFVVQIKVIATTTSFWYFKYLASILQNPVERSFFFGFFSNMFSASSWISFKKGERRSWWFHLKHQLKMRTYNWYLQ